MIKKKNFNKINIVSFFVLILIFSFNVAFSAEIGLFSNFNEYRVGDNIRVNVNINSKTSVNAVSATINFPKDLLSISSISRSNSIVSLWAVEPTFSNNNGKASFEGVILNGFTGSSGKIITLNFTAKKEGLVEIYFDQTSILANDGNGTEVVSSKNPINFIIKEAIAKPVEQTEEDINEKEETKIIEIPKETILKIREIEKENKIPENYLLLLVCLLIILLLIIIIVYGIYYINKFKSYIRKKIVKTEEEVKDNFEKLEEDIEEEMTSSGIKFDSINKGYKSIRKIERDIEESKEDILEDIKEIEKES